jgi:hypothetical protein
MSQSETSAKETSELQPTSANVFVMGMNRFIRPILAATLFISVLPLFQNCAPNEVGYSEIPQTLPVEPAEVEEPAPQPGPSGILGQVTNALTNAPLSNVSVQVRRASAPLEILKTYTTDASGQFQTEDMEPGDYLLDFTASGFIPVKGATAVLVSGRDTAINQSLSGAIQNDQIRIVLNWTGPKLAAVEDVDAYILHPGAKLPIYFNGRSGDGIQLDIDIRYWRGPETITITSLKTGSYRYYVNNYSNPFDRTALGKSDVKVAVYRGPSLYKIYTVPPGAGVTYEVFRIENGIILDVERFNDSLLVVD